MTNFRTIIVPEAVKSIYAEDPTVFAVVQQLEKVVCSQKMSLKELADNIEARLLERHAATEVGWLNIQGQKFKFILLASAYDVSYLERLETNLRGCRSVEMCSSLKMWVLLNQSKVMLVKKTVTVVLISKTRTVRTGPKCPPTKLRKRTSSSLPPWQRRSSLRPTKPLYSIATVGDKMSWDTSPKTGLFYVLLTSKGGNIAFLPHPLRAMLCPCSSYL